MDKGRFSRRYLGLSGSIFAREGRGRNSAACTPQQARPGTECRTTPQYIDAAGRTGSQCVLGAAELTAQHGSRPSSMEAHQVGAAVTVLPLVQRRCTAGIGRAPIRAAETKELVAGVCVLQLERRATGVRRGST
eukprot:scaffold55786_cov36-Phaeocystis_antarctica.AAC.1